MTSGVGAARTIGEAAAAAGGAEDVAPPGHVDVAELRRLSGDDRLAPYRLTPGRLAAYLAGVRGMVAAGTALDAEDPGAALDPDRQPALRPWQLGASDPAAADPVQLVTAAIAARPALAAAIRPHVPLDAFAAAHVKLTVCVRAMLFIAGEQAGELTAAAAERWFAARSPRPGAEADFAVSVATVADGRAAIDAAFDPR